MCSVKFMLKSNPSVYLYSMASQTSSSAKDFDPERKGAEGKVAVPAIGTKIEHAAFATPPPLDTLRKFKLTGERLSTSRTLLHISSSVLHSGYEFMEPAIALGETTATAPSIGAGQYVLPSVIAIGATVAFCHFRVITLKIL